MHLTPLKVEMLLWYYHSPTDYGAENPLYQAHSAALDEMLDCGLISEDAAIFDGQKYGITDKGNALVRAILSVPMPKQVWVVEWANG